MYHRFVKKKLAKAFHGLNEGRAEAVTGEFGERAVHYFIGNHSLSGTRTTPPQIAAWYARLLRLMPTIHFGLEDIVSKGPPWDTLATVQWRERNSGTDGVVTSNEGINVIRIKWGRVTSVSIYTDTVVLVQTLDRLAAKGVEEARAPPIEG